MVSYAHRELDSTPCHPYECLFASSPFVVLNFRLDENNHLVLINHSCPFNSCSAYLLAGSVPSSRVVRFALLTLAPHLRSEPSRSPLVSCDPRAKPAALPAPSAALTPNLAANLSKFVTASSAHRKRLTSSHACSAPVLHGPCDLATSQFYSLSAAPRFPRFSLLLSSRSRLFQSRRLHLTGPSAALTPLPTPLKLPLLQSVTTHS